MNLHWPELRLKHKTDLYLQGSNTTPEKPRVIHELLDSPTLQPKTSHRSDFHEKNSRGNNRTIFVHVSPGSDVITIVSRSTFAGNVMTSPLLSRTRSKMKPSLEVSSSKVTTHWSKPSRPRIAMCETRTKSRKSTCKKTAKGLNLRSIYLIFCGLPTCIISSSSVVLGAQAPPLRNPAWLSSLEKRGSVDRK